VSHMSQIYQEKNTNSKKNNMQMFFKAVKPWPRDEDREHKD